MVLKDFVSLRLFWRSSTNCCDKQPALRTYFHLYFSMFSMPYAQEHYPFENKEEFEKSFPADFIAEGIDQTRGWYVEIIFDC